MSGATQEIAFDAAALAGQVTQLPSLPAVCERLNEIVNDPLSSNRDVARVIGEDPGLAVRLLRLANSDFYGFPSRIETITHAVTIIGTHQLRDLALTAAASGPFGEDDERHLELEAFWCHSVACAVACRILASCRNEANIEYFFIAGLLHDIGRLVIMSEIPDRYHAVLAESVEHGELLHEVERRMLGFDHADVGAALLRRWNLPESLVSAVEAHLCPATAAADWRLCAAIVHVADIIVTALEASSGAERLIPPLDSDGWDCLDLPVTVLPWVLKQLECQYQETVAMMLRRAS